jgi:hypothetical protein
VVNGHFASQRSKGLSRMYSRPREGLLEAIVAQFRKVKPATLMLSSKTNSTIKRCVAFLLLEPLNEFV